MVGTITLTLDPKATDATPSAIAVQYSLTAERAVLASKRKKLFIFSVCAFVILTLLAWLSLRWTLRPLVSHVHWMTGEFDLLSQGGQSTGNLNKTVWQEERDYVNFHKEATAVLAVLKEAEDYGLTDKTASGEQT